MLKKAASILLAFLFLVSSSHLSFATHFCGGHVHKRELLVDASDFGCGMEKGTTACEIPIKKLEKKCCDTEIVVLQINDNFQTTNTQINANQFFVLVNVVQLIFNLPANKREFTNYKDYKPPIPDKDIPVLIQSFLI